MFGQTGCDFLAVDDLFGAWEQKHYVKNKETTAISEMPK